jgi:tetrahydromethanopterin S-methyltransferase subunit B
MQTKSFKLIFSLVLISICTTALSLAQTNPQNQKVQLFNGKDLSNWSFKLRDPAVDPATVFTIQNGVIHILGNPFGYMRTKDVYSNYKLHVEWRYPTELSNSGVFIHAQGPDTIWPLTIECQLKAGSAGDFVCMSVGDMNERIDKTNRMVTKLVPSVEKPVSEWNTMEITCKGNTIEVYINGTLMNKATGVSISKGSICLQSEGKDVEFRNVYITGL